MNSPKINNHIIAIVLILSIAIMGIAENAGALTLKMSLEELASGADFIIVGKVLHQESHWNRDKTAIYTKVVISTEEHLKGRAKSDDITIAVPGGKIGDTTVEVTDVPDFSVGEKVVIFVRPLTDKQVADDGLVTAGDDAPWFRIHGGFQGKFSVLEDKIGNLPLVKFKERISKALTGGVPAYPESESMLNPESVSSIQTISGISPSSASAGTNTLISISGNGFGASTGTPYFYYKDNGYYGCQSCVSAWSDSDVVVKVPVFTAINGYSASAGSGPVYLTTPAGDKSNAFPFTVTFSYGGIKWTGASPVVEFKVNTNGNAAILKAVQDAADTWNAVPNKSFSFKYAGTTSAVKTSGNQINEIIWADLQDGIIGQASMRSIGGVISECDITFNTKFKWNSDASTPKDAMDVHTIALHEMGHWLNLRDLYGNVSGYPTDIDKIMYGYGGYGVQKRTLTLYDTLGMRYIYPGANPCAASLSLTNSPYHLFVPILNTTPNLWVDFQNDPSLSTNMMFRLINYSETTNPDGYKVCQPSILSWVDGNYILQIPELIFDGTSYRIDLTYVPTTDGLIWFMLSGVWTN
ncbi:MAG: matrixin family metalloprotease [Deltaproteobacteria bacterium]|nr:matrixin family metalloprotease [Deltaproteobacteria bacterium]